MTCAKCGGPITATFCSKCGAPVGTAAPAPAPAGAYAPAAPFGAPAPPPGPPGFASPSPPYGAPPVTSPYGAPPAPPGVTPYAPPYPPMDGLGTSTWAPAKPARKKARRPWKVIGIVVLVLIAVVVAIGIINPSHVPDANEISDWHVGACVRITDKEGSAYPVKCEKSNDGYITAQVATGDQCPTRMYVTRPDAVWCVQLTDPSAVENVPEDTQ